jgi:hypothetical protein
MNFCKSRFGLLAVPVSGSVRAVRGDLPQVANQQFRRNVDLEVLERQAGQLDAAGELDRLALFLVSAGALVLYSLVDQDVRSVLALPLAIVMVLSGTLPEMPSVPSTCASKPVMTPLRCRSCHAQHDGPRGRDGCGR